MKLVKYPRTQHVEGSRLQPGDEDIHALRFEAIRGRTLVVEEKLDGANAALSFDAAGKLLLQSRGHYLVGGEREKHFALFKTWAGVHQVRLRERLGPRYVAFGEWLYAKHTIFYDCDERNRARSEPVPERALAKMLEHWQVPDVTECTELVI